MIDDACGECSALRREELPHDKWWGVCLGWLPIGIYLHLAILATLSLASCGHSVSQHWPVTPAVAAAHVRSVDGGTAWIADEHHLVTAASICPKVGDGFTLAGAANWVLGSTGNSCASFIYDGTAARWKMNAKTGTTVPEVVNTGALVEGGTLAVTGVTGTLDNYAPTGITSAAILDLTNTSSSTLNGISMGQVKGQRLTILNNATSVGTLTIAHSAGGSLAANRFSLPSGVSWILSGGNMLTFVYDGTIWRLESIGSSRFGALTVDGITLLSGAVTSASQFYLTGTSSPTALAGTANDYAPANSAGASLIRQDVSAPSTITGLANGTGGRLFIISNIATAAANTLTFTNEDTLSVASNRFALQNTASCTLGIGDAVMFRYDNVSSRWRPITPCPHPALTAYPNATISPTATTGTVNDYAPTGLANATIIRQDTSGTTTITGLTRGQDGRQITIVNIGANAITLNNESASSTAANRFLNFASSNQVLTAGGGSATYTYDSTSSRWRLLAITTATHNESAAFAGNVTIAGGAKIKDTGTAAVPSACGVTPTISAGAWAATVVVGATGTGCVISFSGTFIADPTCVYSAQSGVNVAYTHTPNDLTLGAGTAPGSYDFICVGH